MFASTPPSLIPPRISSKRQAAMEAIQNIHYIIVWHASLSRSLALSFAIPAAAAVNPTDRQQLLLFTPSHSAAPPPPRFSPPSLYNLR